MPAAGPRPLLRLGATRHLKVVAACGNGTAGAFAPKALAAIGCEVVPLHCALDHSFPNHNPNPEDLAMLRALSVRVVEGGADLGRAFDGDGDRCGFVDNEGEAIFADKSEVMLARHPVEADAPTSRHYSRPDRSEGRAIHLVPSGNRRLTFTA